MDLGDKFKRIRYINNLSQEQMAIVLGINRNYLSRIETNKSLPTTEILTKLSENFNVSIDSLLGVGLVDKKNDKLRTSKIKKITRYCSELSINELDFIINLLSVMTNK